MDRRRTTAFNIVCSFFTQTVSNISTQSMISGEGCWKKCVFECIKYSVSDLSVTFALISNISVEKNWTKIRKKSCKEKKVLFANFENVTYEPTTALKKCFQFDGISRKFTACSVRGIIIGIGQFIPREISINNPRAANWVNFSRSNIVKYAKILCLHSWRKFVWQ